MLKTTYPKILVEATSDRLWGTGVPMHDSNILKLEKWFGLGWLSEMLEKIKEST